ncbi:thioredoxin domain-containing protein [Modestobacter caceresii]|uniref:hypothetical protein n=1 Tax=Modestobacter caceresii TaxID=1522368 RepID=UPI0018CE2F26|nr:hypothetical protein [Modestobacter caceresii]
MAVADDRERPQQRATPSEGSLLEVYVTAGCLGCVRARELVAHLRRTRPGAAAETIDLDWLPPEARPAGLVGTPTYRLGGRVRWLGNPSTEELLAAWDEEVG